MSDIIIPPHLKIAESVTDAEYQSAVREKRIVVIILFIAGIIVTTTTIFSFGLLVGITAAVVILLALERILNRFFKHAHKANTIRMSRYRELKAYKEGINKKRLKES